ncbi:MAG: oligosaccharide flippase family protein [Sulfuricaulis sp.]
MSDSSRKTLRQRVVRASLWTMAGHVVGLFVRLASSLIMTRLLVPEMYGVMSVAWVIMYGLQMFSDLGLRQSIVQNARGHESRFLRTAWAIMIIRGCLLWFIGLVVAVALHYGQSLHLMAPGTVYSNPLLPLVIAILSSTAFIIGFESTKISMADRDLALGRISQLEILSQVVSVASMIAWAWVDRSIWALVAGGVVYALVKTVSSHLWLPGLPDKWAWDHEAFREIIHFGKWVFLSSILGFAVNSGDRLLLGGLISTTALGFYAIGFMIVDSVNLVLNKLFSSVSFPALSEIARGKPSEFKRTYYRFRIPIDLFTLFAAGLMFTGGEALISLLYDNRYSAAGHIVQVLSVSFIFTRYGVAEICCLALGKPSFLSGQIAARGIALYALVPPAFHYFGFNGALWIIALHRAFSIAPVFYFKIKHGLVDMKKELIVLPMLLVGGAAGEVFSRLVGLLLHR